LVSNSTWTDVIKDPRWLEFDEDTRLKIKTDYWDKVILKDPEFETFTPQQQEKLKSDFFSGAPTPSGIDTAGAVGGGSSAGGGLTLATEKSKEWTTAPKKETYETIAELGEIKQGGRSDFQYIYDTAKLASVDMWYRSKGGVATMGESFFREVSPEDVEVMLKKNNLPIPSTAQLKEVTEKINENRVGIRTKFEQYHDKSMKEYQGFLETHAHWLGPEKWQGEVLDRIKENPLLLADVGYWAYVAARNAPLLMMSAAVGTGVTAATGNPILGALAVSAAIAPAETEDVRNELEQRGMPADEAIKLATTWGPAIASIEAVGELPAMIAGSKAVMALFKRTLVDEIFRQSARTAIGAGAKVAGKTVAGEALFEEPMQQIMHNALIRLVDENQSYFEGVLNAGATAAMSVMPVALFGAGSEMQVFNMLQQSSDLNLEAQAAIQVEGLEEKISKEQEAKIIEMSEKAGETVSFTPEELGHSRELSKEAKIQSNVQKLNVSEESKVSKKSIEQQIPQANPEDIPSDVVGFLPGGVKTLELLSTTARKLQRLWDVEAPLAAVGASETGFRLKNYHSDVDARYRQGLTTIYKINNMMKEAELTPDDLSEISFALESAVYFDKLTPEQKTKYKPIMDEYVAFRTKWAKDLKNVGFLEEEFPQSLIRRNDLAIADIQKKLLSPNTTAPHKVQLQEELKRLQEQNARIASLKMSFVSVPVKMLFATNKTVYEKFLRTLPQWNRTTVLVKDLVDAGVMTKEQADIRKIVGEYTARMSKVYALGQIFKSATAEGLVVPEAQAPDGWVSFTARYVPQLKGMRINPEFNNMLTAYFGAVNQRGATSAWHHLVGITKMMAFYNPVFLPMYDVMQAAVAGTFFSKNTPRYIKDAYQMMRDKSPEYWAALENGLASKPFSLRFDEYNRKVASLIRNETLTKAIGDKVKNPLMAVYELSWQTAWQLDEFVRLMTYNHYRDLGFNERDSAQTAAMFHADYASVPPDTRKALNAFLFTPTFKITMFKLYGEMAKGVVNTAFHPKTATPLDKQYAQGAVAALGMSLGITAFFKSMGFEEEEVFRKYTKRVETDEGPRELAITISNPFNLLSRYYYRAKGIIDSPKLNQAATFMEKAVRPELTPLLRVGYDIYHNYNNQVYTFGDDPDRRMLDILRYATKEVIAITKPVVDTVTRTPEERISAQAEWKAYEESLGKLWAYALEPFVFHYTGATKDQRLLRTMRQLEKAYTDALIKTKDPEARGRMIKNFYKQLEKYQKQLDEYSKTLYNE